MQAHFGPLGAAERLEFPRKLLGLLLGEERGHYLETLTQETRRRFDAGPSAEEASFDIALSEFDPWLDAERVSFNVHTLYREFRGATEAATILAMFAGMARVRARRGRR